MLRKGTLFVLIFLGLGLTTQAKAMNHLVIAPLYLQNEKTDKVNPSHYELEDINKHHPFWQWTWD